MSAAEPQAPEPAPGAPHETHMGRRRFIQATAAAGAAAVGGVTYGTDDAEALWPVVAAVGGAAVVGYVLGEWDPLESDSPPEGLTSGALQDRAYQIALTRESTNASSIVDSENLVNASKNDAYAKGKIAAIEALNDELTESEVVDAAHAAVDAKEATVKGNELKTWNESINELENLATAASDHSDLSVSNIMSVSTENSTSLTGTNWEGAGTRSIDLPDGSSMDIRTLNFHVSETYQGGEIGNGGTGTVTWDPTNFSKPSGGWGYSSCRVHVSSSETVRYLSYNDWSAIFDKIGSAYTEVRNGLSMWVSTVYGDVQSGELNPEELFSPGELAQLMPDGEGYPQAVADLMALGYAVDLERKTTIELSKVDGSISGTLALSSEPSDPLETAETIDPTAQSEDYYFTYDVSKGSGIWSEYQTGIDGGIITFTSDPYTRSIYTIETTAGETLELAATKFTANDAGDAWTYDAGAELDEAITEIDSVEFRADVEGTHYQTVQLEQEFTITEIENVKTGDTTDTVEFTQNTTQTDDNYITQSEWDELRKQNEELIDKYEKAKNSGGPLSGLFGGGSILGGAGGAGTLVVWAVGGVAAVLGLSKLAESDDDGGAR